MPAKKADLSHLITVATELFCKQGYHKTSVKDIAAACELSKASIYHHIASKEALAVEALDRTHLYCREQIFAIAYNDEREENSRFFDFADRLESYFYERNGACLMSCLAHEVADVVPAFIEKIRVFFMEWEEAVTHLLKNKYDLETATLLAQDAVSQAQGAIMMFRVYQDTSRLRRMTQQLVSLWDVD